MVTIESRVRKWGNSLGVIIPKDVAEKEHLMEDQKITLVILKNNQTVRKTFGLLKGKLKKSTQQLMDEARKELYND